MSNLLTPFFLIFYLLSLINYFPNKLIAFKVTISGVTDIRSLSATDSAPVRRQM